MKEKLLSFFEPREEVLFAFLFGSTVKGRTTPLSDMDIAVFVDPARIREGDYRYGYHAFLASLLMSHLKTNKVDLVILNEAPPVLKQKILSQGIEIFCRTPEVKGKFVLSSLRQYLDTMVLRQIQSFYLNRRLKELGPHPPHG